MRTPVRVIVMSLLVTCLCSCSFLAVRPSPSVSVRDPSSRASCSSYIAPVADGVLVPVLLYLGAAIVGGKGSGEDKTTPLLLWLTPPSVVLASSVYGFVANGVCRRRLARREAAGAGAQPPPSL